MKQTPSKVLHRLMIVIPITFLIGLLMLFLKYKTAGIAVLAGGGLALIVAIIGYYRIKKNDPVGITKAWYAFFILGGAVLLILSLAVFIFERENFKDVIFEVISGIVLLAYGIYSLKSKQTQKTTWKEIPLGMRIIIIFFSITIVFGLIDLSVNSQQPIFLFGFIIQSPLSVILSAIFLIIPILVIFLIYKKVGWKIIFGLQSFNLLNGIIGAIKILSTPLPQLFAMLNRPLPNVSPEVLQAAELKSKLIVSIPMFTGIIISLIILIYVYKKKEYFTD